MILNLAVLISIGALIISAFSLGWNIYRDIILKPKLLIRFGLKQIVTSGKLSEELIVLSGTNFGPGEINCTGVIISKDSIARRLMRQWRIGFGVPDFDHPLCHKLPSRLEMAQEVTLIFPLSVECILAYKPSRIGIQDSFGRTHWAPDKETRDAVAAFNKKFPKSERQHFSKV